VPHLRAVLEVRHPSWLAPAVVDRLRAANVALCLADWRECPVREIITADFVYVRRHGTRRRYGGSYSEVQLRQDAAAIHRWRQRDLDVYVYFNNDGHAAAVRNATRLRALLCAPRYAVLRAPSKRSGYTRAMSGSIRVDAGDGIAYREDSSA
jgi:uncharacterized protein YecE (DUF72 family)